MFYKQKAERGIFVASLMRIEEKTEARSFFCSKADEEAESADWYFLF